MSGILQSVIGSMAEIPPAWLVNDVFSYNHYQGTASTMVINNGVDLDGEGGMVWIKDRTTSFNHALQDTERWSLANNAILMSDSTAVSQAYTNSITSFNSNGFTLGSQNLTNATGPRWFASWTFRKAPGFFDIVTWTGDSTNREIAHNLGSIPGCIMIKSTSNSEHWAVYHRSLANTQYLRLNAMQEVETGGHWNSTTPTDSVFTVGNDTESNYTGYDYVAYVFAHDAEVFGANRNKDIIQCGGFTGNTTTSLGWRPQYILVKQTDNGYGGADSNWRIADTGRNLGASSAHDVLYANSNSAEVANYNRINITSSGFTSANYGASNTFIYIAIREE